MMMLIIDIRHLLCNQSLCLHEKTDGGGADNVLWAGAP